MGDAQTTRIRRKRQFVDWSIVEYKGFPHLLFVRGLRRAMLNKAVDRHDVDSMLTLAAACGVSRSTVSRLFSGRNTSLPLLLLVLDVLEVRFEDVCFRIDDETLLSRLMEGAINRNGVIVPEVNPASLPEVARFMKAGSITPALPSAPRERRLGSGRE